MGKLFVAMLVLAITGCAHHGGGDDDDTEYSSLRVTPDPVTLVVPLGGSTAQDYKVLGTDSTGEHDITAKCAFGIDASFGTFTDATVNAVAHGGTTQVTAACGQQSASATLNIDITASEVTGTAPTNSDQLFGTATTGTDPARTPVIEYPIDLAVAPLNLPSIEMQWKTGANDLFHVHLQSTHASLDVYTTDPQHTYSEDKWISIANTAVGDKLVITVEGLAQASPATKFASTPVTFNLSHDTIDTSAIYWWASSQGSIMSQTFGQTGAPTVVKDNCSGCHSLSRAGSRIGYSRCVAGSCNGEWVGFMRYDSNTASWNEVVNADAKTIPGTYTTFAPPGNPFPDDTQSVAIVTSMSGTFDLFDPDTGTAVPSNLSSVTPMAGHSATMPDWSPDGSLVTFASAGAGQSVDVSGSSIAMMSYAYTGGAHTFGTPSVLVQQPIQYGGQTYNNLFFPSFSADGQWIVFNAARASWRKFDALQARYAGQRLMLVNPAGGPPIDLTAMNGGNVDYDMTWPHWAPGATSDYYWVVFSSERDYGHEVTGTHTAPSCVANGVAQCKQIWIGAISRQALMSGQLDPSSPPVWVPGQDTQADNISPYWTVPAGLF
jgi:WD40 repeat protein